MNKQQFKPYWDVIVQLIKHPTQAEREKILNENAELVNSVLVEQISLASMAFQQGGNLAQAEDLKQYSMALAERLKILPDSKTEEGRQLIEHQKFIYQCLECVSNSLSKEEVYRFFRDNELKLTEDKLVEALSSLGSIIYSGVEDISRRRMAANLLGEFARLIHQFPYGDRAINIELAIIAYEVSLKVLTPDTSLEDWLHVMNGLGLAYVYRMRGEKSENIETAITTYAKALKEVSPAKNTYDWGQLLMNLGSAYCYRLKGDRPQNIEKAITIHKRVLQVRNKATNSFLWAQSKINLGIAYAARLKGNKAKNIDLALQAYANALEVLTQEEHPQEWAIIMMNLGIAYDERSTGDRAENIENAIRFYKYALRIFNYEDSVYEWAKTTMNLAVAYYMRVKGDRAENIEDAISTNLKALKFIGKETLSVDWSQAMSNLGLAYLNRIKGDHLENIEKAIVCYKDSLLVRTREDMAIEWAQTTVNLSMAYAKLAQKRNKSLNQQKSILLCKEALQVLTVEKTPTFWSLAINNLSATYADRGTQEDLELAIETCQQAIEVRNKQDSPVEWALLKMNLGLIYKKQTATDRIQNIEKAIISYREALTVFTPETLPVDCRKTAYQLATFLATLNRWEEACQEYKVSLMAAERLYQATPFRQNQEAELIETNDLFSRAAYAHAKCGYLEEAVVILEQSRARGLSNALERNSEVLSGLKKDFPDVYKQYEKAANALFQLEREERSNVIPVTESPFNSLSINLRHQFETAQQAFQDAINLVRLQTHYKDFFAPVEWSDVAKAIEFNEPLVYVLHTFDGGLALILHRSKHDQRVHINPIWLDSLTDQFMEVQLFGIERATDTSTGKENPLCWFRAYKSQHDDHKAWVQAMDLMMRSLWEVLMEPVINALEENRLAQAVLIPTGYFSFLPLHAAWIDDNNVLTKRRYALDHIRFSYSPNAKALQVTRERLANETNGSLLMINEPQASDVDPLPNSSREAKSVINYFPNHQELRHKHATREAVLSALSNHSVFHFSCHGTVNWIEPLKSGLIMAGGELLTIQDFFDLQLQDIRLAVLSACETGLPGIKLPDEVVNLPAALIQAGISGVVSSLWPVTDLSTMLLLSKFYALWLNQDFEPAEALTRAQKWLRDADPSDIETHCKTFIPELSSRDDEVSTAIQTLRRALRLDYSHPYYWAAFTYTGM